MVEKLLKQNGLSLQISKCIKESSMLVFAPFFGDRTEDERRAMIDKYMDEKEAARAFTRIYAKHFTLSEMLDLMAFYRTPGGKKMCQVQVQEQISREMISEVNAMVARLFARASRGELGELEDPDKYEEILP
jgi:hypothetical protein